MERPLLGRIPRSGLVFRAFLHEIQLDDLVAPDKGLDHLGRVVAERVDHVVDSGHRQAADQCGAEESHDEPAGWNRTLRQSGAS